MKTAYFIVLLFYCSHALSCDKYISIGGGYKIHEPDHIVINKEEKVPVDFGGKITARIEIGCENNSWRWGLSHHSQWFDGWPMNDNGEYYKTELFIDKKIRF